MKGKLFLSLPLEHQVRIHKLNLRLIQLSNHSSMKKVHLNRPFSNDVVLYQMLPVHYNTTEYISHQVWSDIRDFSCKVDNLHWKNNEKQLHREQYRMNVVWYYWFLKDHQECSQLQIECLLDSFRLFHEQSEWFLKPETKLLMKRKTNETEFTKSNPVTETLFACLAI